MNNKLLLLILIVCALLLSALIARNGKLLLLAMPFLVYLIIGLIQAPSEVTLLAERTIDKPNAIAEEPIEQSILIKDQGNALRNLYISDTLFPSMTVLDGRSDHRLSLPAGGSAKLNYVFKAARGIYSWKMIHASASDPFGLFELVCDIPASGEVCVRPAPIQIRRIPLKPNFTLHAAGPISARRGGSGTDFWGIREYRTGDSLRRLNWRLAARHPRRLFTNEYEREEIADFGLILDARRLTHADEMEEALFEYSVSAAASLSEHYLRNGNRVALLTFGESITSVFPGYGKKQLNSLLRNLAGARLGANLPFGYLEYFPARLFPSRSLIVIFSPVDFRDLETYARLRALGYDVLLISPDPVDYAAGSLPLTEINALAIRAARLERVIQLKRLLKLGVKVINWQINNPLEIVVHKTARYFLHRRNI